MRRAALVLCAVVAGALSSGCASAPKSAGGDFDRYLEEFEAVRSQGEELYLKAGVVADARVQVSTGAAQAALEARLDALRLVARYNRLLIALARGEDPKALKSEMNTIGGKLSAYRPSAQAQQFALASAVPYLGALVQGAAFVRDALAKRRFMSAVHEAQKPIALILDILVADSAPLEELLVQDLRRQQDPSRARVDGVGSRYYRKLTGLRSDAELQRGLERLNALRARAGRPPIPYEPGPKTAAATPDERELLQALVDEAETAALESARLDERVEAQRALFSRYREALAAAKRSLAALNGDSDAARDTETDRFSAQALDLRRQAVRLKEGP